MLLECPEQDCSKKYKHANGLKYHQSHAHGAAGSMDEDSQQLPESPRGAPPTTPSPAPATPQPSNSEPPTPPAQSPGPPVSITQSSSVSSPSANIVSTVSTSVIAAAAAAVTATITVAGLSTAAITSTANSSSTLLTTITSTTTTTATTTTVSSGIVVSVTSSVASTTNLLTPSTQQSAAATVATPTPPLVVGGSIPIQSIGGAGTLMTTVNLPPNMVSNVSSALIVNQQPSAPSTPLVLQPHSIAGGSITTGIAAGPTAIQQHQQQQHSHHSMHSQQQLPQSLIVGAPGQNIVSSQQSISSDANISSPLSSGQSSQQNSQQQQQQQSQPINILQTPTRSDVQSKSMSQSYFLFLYCVLINQIPDFS